MSKTALPSFNILREPSDAAKKALLDQKAMVQIMPRIPYAEDSAFQVLDLYIESEHVAEGPSYTCLSEYLISLNEQISE